MTPSRRWSLGCLVLTLVATALSFQDPFMLPRVGARLHRQGVGARSGVRSFGKRRRGGRVEDAGLDDHFVHQFGIDRWPALRAALEAPVEHVLLANPFADDAWSHRIGELDWQLLRAKAGVSVFFRESPVVDNHEEEGAMEDENGMMARAPEPQPMPLLPALVADGDTLGRAGVVSSHYVLDGASPLPALALAVEPGHRVLDLCAAPGGKSLVLAAQLFRGSSRDEGAPRPGFLVANDRSAPRRGRLRRVLLEYLPPDWLVEVDEVQEDGHRGEQNRVVVCGEDAAGWGRGGWTAGRPWAQAFDRILLDAPCSSERHIVRGAKGAVWSQGRLKRDAQLQLSMLKSALHVLRPGGRIVYSTCSLASEENDDVIGRLLRLKKFQSCVRTVSPLANLQGLGDLTKGVEETEFGAIMLPDRSKFGPLYWAVLEKTEMDGSGNGGGGAQAQS